MLSRGLVQRLRDLNTNGHFVLSVFLDLEPGVETSRSSTIRLKDLLAGAAAVSESLPRSERMSLHGDIEAVADVVRVAGSEEGRALAVFRSEAADLDETVWLPVPVRDRAIVDARPYLRPLEAMLEHFRRYAVVVIERRRAGIYHFAMDRLGAREEMTEEEIRKSNWGGFSGYEERRVRARADEVAARHYRDVAARLYEMWRDGPGFDLVIVGGPDEHVDGLIAVLHPDLGTRVAGRFTIDPGTMTDAVIAEQGRRVAREHEEAEQRELVDQMMGIAAGGGLATIGVEAVRDAVNRKAVDVLVIQGGQTHPGAVCTNCGWLVPEGGTRCPTCSGEVRPLPDQLDAIAVAVRAAGGEVRHVLVETPLQPYEVGATLRYRADSSDQR